MSRKTDKSGSFAAIINLAVLASDDADAQSMQIGITISDFRVPVIPALVPRSSKESAIALTGEKTLNSANELFTFSRVPARFSRSRSVAELFCKDEEVPAVAKPRATCSPRSSAEATTSGRRTTRKSQK